MRIVGVVLAGGRSTRFGSEKAVALVDGEPMIAHVAAVLAKDCAAVAVNAPQDSGAAAWARTRGLDVLPDPPGLPNGPLAGVLAGLAWAEAQGAELLATAPCDTPRLPADLVARLAEELVEAPAAFATTSDGAQPLCGVWLPKVRAGLEDTLRDGHHPPIQNWLREIGSREVRFDSRRAFDNVNRRRSFLFGAWEAPALAAFALTGWPILLLLAFGLTAPLFPQGLADPLYNDLFYDTWLAGLIAFLVAAAVVAYRQLRRGSVRRSRR